MSGDTSVTPNSRVELDSHVSSSRQPCIVSDDGTNQSMVMDPCTVVRRRRRRHNREGTIYGNNRVGRKGKLICDYCRKRRIKCNYETLGSPCEFCRSHNKAVCIKRLGPKTEVRLSPTKPMPIYDPSIPSEDITCLQYLYSTSTDILCGSVKLDVLARALGRIYGPSISYPGLRHMIIALLMSKSGIRTISPYPTQSGKQHVDIVIGELAEKLSDPSKLDEADIFVAYLLAMWSDGKTNPATTEVHAEGVIAIMRHLSRNLGVPFYASPMAPFWALLRDEIIWLTRKSVNCYRMCQDFRDILGPKTIQQRQRYEKELREAMIPEYDKSDEKVFFGRTMHTSIHTMVDSARIINQRYPLQTSQDPLLESVLVELRVEEILIERRQHEPFLELELAPLQKGEYVENWKVELKIVERFYDLLILYICRIAAIALEAPSIEQGLNSSKGIKTSASLISILRRSRAFFQSGIRDERVFGTGLGNSYESYKVYKKWPCKQLVEAILRNAPGHPGLTEVVDCMGGLVNDFSRFQEIYINRWETERLILNQLASFKACC